MKVMSAGAAMLDGRRVWWEGGESDKGVNTALSECPGRRVGGWAGAGGAFYGRGV